MDKLLLIAAGGAAGSVLRYLLAGVVQQAGGVTFPVGTLAVNLLGCLLVGLLAGLLSGPVLMDPRWRLAILVGVLGGFTTFSTYGLETLRLMETGQWSMAGLNVLLSNGLGLAGVWLGLRVSAAWQGA